MFKAGKKKEMNKSSKTEEIKVQEECISCNDTSILNCPGILTGLSHEVRTYMNSIVAFSYLQNNASNNDQQNYSGQIFNSCEQLITLFDNFLDSALLEAEMPVTNFNKAVIDNVLQKLSVDLNNSLSRFDKQNVTLVLEKHPSQDEVYIDEDKIIRVIKNLFLNSVEHTTTGYIKLGYKKRNNQLIFYVIDSGNGYHLNRELLGSNEIPVFPSQNNSTFTTVGLILAQKLINAMEGRLWVEPNGVNGSALFFSVKYRNAAAKPAGEDLNLKSRIAI